MQSWVILCSSSTQNRDVPDDHMTNSSLSVTKRPSRWLL